MSWFNNDEDDAHKQDRQSKDSKGAVSYRLSSLALYPHGEMILAALNLLADSPHWPGELGDAQNPDGTFRYSACIDETGTIRSIPVGEELKPGWVLIT